VKAVALTWGLDLPGEAGSGSSWDSGESALVGHESDAEARYGDLDADPTGIASDQFRLLVESTVDYAIFMLTPTGHIRTWNSGAERIKGYRAPEIIGQHFSVFYTDEARASGHPDNELRIAAREGRYAEEGWRVRKDGSLLWASVTITALRDRRGTLVGFGKVTRDLTDRRREAIATARLQADQQRTFDAVAEGIIFYSLSASGLVVRQANAAAYAMLDVDVAGLEAFAAGTRPLPGICDAAGQAVARAQLPDMVTGVSGQPVDQFVWGWTDRPGHTKWLNSSSRPVLDDVGTLVGIVFSMLDITERHDARLALVRAQARFGALVEHSSDVICILDTAGTVRYASPAYLTVYGEQPSARLNRPLIDRLHPEDAAKLQRILEQLVVSPHETRTVDCRVIRPDGSRRHVELTATSHLLDPAVAGIVTNSRDVTERVETAARLAYEALHDALTGLANRTLLLDRLSQALGRSKRTGTRCALLFIDLDHFKNVNDSLGHDSGDKLLVAVARQLERVLRPGDTLARIGGDEFVILAEQIADTPTAEGIAERAGQVVAEPVLVDGRMISAACSIGITLSNGARPDELLQQADTALYRAKARGRSRWELYDQAMRVGAQRRIDTEAQIRRSLDTGGVVVHYQPIVALATGERIGSEALVRLTDPVGRMILPDEFIPTAEDSGLILALGAEVLRQGCCQQARWIALGAEPPQRISVNVSPRQLQHPTLAADVARTLDEAGLSGADLCLELTETALIEADHSTRRTVNDLADLGILIALDDFGTGWSSLAYLHRFPIGVVKIDRSFVAGLGRDPGDTEIVKAIVSLGLSLGLTVVAEGVETKPQAMQLHALGCHQAQGNLYGAATAPADHG
jgi:diguanylate cyclase (GGDEF)-like protein/PAS domain S-box-containing protein